MAAEKLVPGLSSIRNLGVIAHIDAGKTTTTEHLLYYSGVKHKLGGVDEGTTETDYDPEEQERGITIYSACVPFRWKECTINLIDTPGHVDFTAEVERSLRVLDGAVVVFDAQKGVEAQSETVWRQANKYRVPRLVFINKMDVVGADFGDCLQQIRERLQSFGTEPGHLGPSQPVAINIPIGSGSVKDSPTPFGGVIDLLEMRALYFEVSDFGKTMRVEAIPAESAEEAKRYREALFDVLTQTDEELTAVILEGREPEPQLVRKAIREQTIRGQIQPVLCGSGREHAGIQPLLDAVTWYLPSPLERPAVEGENPRKDGRIEKRKPDPKEPFCGLVFKIIAEEHGELFFVRIYSGTLKVNSRVYNPGKDTKEVIGKLFHIHADPRQRDDLPEAYAGDIVAAMGLKDTTTGDTLCETQHPILLEPITFAQAVVTQRIEPESSADRKKLLDTLNRLRREDPTFLFKENPETGSLEMSGMGTLHLEVKRHRMERDFRLKVRVGQPLVSYRETLRRPVRTEGECDRQIGTKRLVGRLTVEFDNKKLDQPITVTSKLKPGVLTPSLLAAAEIGLRSALQTGEFGNPLLNVQATIVAAHMDPENSEEAAFEIAAAEAVQQALKDNTIILEPMMKLSVTVPGEFLGSVMSDLMTHRADIRRQALHGTDSEVEALVPLVEVFDYADRVRSLSQGRASSTMEPHSYAPAPDEVLRAFKGEI